MNDDNRAALIAWAFFLLMILGIVSVINITSALETKWRAENGYEQVSAPGSQSVNIIWQKRKP